MNEAWLTLEKARQRATARQSRTGHHSGIDCRKRDRCRKNGPAAPYFLIEYAKVWCNHKLSSTASRADITLGRAISRKDLATDAPYNTYRILARRAICNPGRDAIAAVLTNSYRRVYCRRWNRRSRLREDIGRAQPECRAVATSSKVQKP